MFPSLVRHSAKILKHTNGVTFNFLGITSCYDNRVSTPFKATKTCGVCYAQSTCHPR